MKVAPTYRLCFCGFWRQSIPGKTLVAGHEYLTCFAQGVKPALRLRRCEFCYVGNLSNRKGNARIGERIKDQRRMLLRCSSLRSYDASWRLLHARRRFQRNRWDLHDGAQARGRETRWVDS